MNPVDAVELVIIRGLLTRAIGLVRCCAESLPAAERMQRLAEIADIDFDSRSAHARATALRARLTPTPEALTDDNTDTEHRLPG